MGIPGVMRRGGGPSGKCPWRGGEGLKYYWGESHPPEVDTSLPHFPGRTLLEVNSLMHRPGICTDCPPHPRGASVLGQTGARGQVVPGGMRCASEEDWGGLGDQDGDSRLL